VSHIMMIQTRWMLDDQDRMRLRSEGEFHSAAEMWTRDATRRGWAVQTTLPNERQVEDLRVWMNRRIERGERKAA
jgi:hypothetical protein